MQGVFERASGIVDRNRTATLCVAIAVLSVLAWSNRFIQDDAFISFRYAQNLVEGAGLTFNPGERVEGYTNFLWTLLMTIPFRLGIDPVLYSQWLGLALFPGSLYFTHRIAWSATGSASVALLAIVLLGTNYTFSIYATGGLETQLHVFALLGATALALGMPRGSAPASSSAPPGSTLGALGISLLAATALLTRMDSAIYLCVLYGYVGLGLLRDGAAASSRSLRTLSLMILPGASIVLIWLAWKISYYGDVFPNTYYAKMITLSESWRPGLRYVWVFVRSYWLLPVLLLPLLLLRRIRAGGNRELALLALLCLVGVGYAVRIGGDFMEFRALVPALPPLFVLLAWLMGSLSARAWISAAFALIVVGGSIHHARTFVWEYGIESVQRLEGHLNAPDEDWARVGSVLGELFGDREDPAIIATTAAGAIPFHARLPTVDMHGITDAWVARNGIRRDPGRTNPGHYRDAQFSYLVERGVNLVVGRPWVDERKPGPRPAFGQHGLARFGIHDPPSQESLPEAAVMKVLEIDISDTHRLFVLYLMGDERIDAVVAEKNIRRHRVLIRRDSS